MNSIIFLLIIVITVSANNFKSISLKQNTQQKKYDILCGVIPRTKGNCGNECEFEFNHNERKLTINGKQMNDYISPLEVPWYVQMKRIETIVFKQTIHIGSNAFNGATQILSISLPETIESIGENAFRNCIRLNSLTIPTSIKSIGEHAFSSCTSLKTIVYKGLINPCERISFDTIGTTSVFVSSNYTNTVFCNLTLFPYDGTCGDNCYWKYDEGGRELILGGNGKMNNNTEEELPWKEYKDNILTITVNGLTSINDYVFQSHTNLESVVIGDSLQSIGINPFIGCSKLTTIEFETNDNFKFEGGILMTKDGKELISYLESNTMEIVELSSTIEIIRDYAFYGNYYLTEITLGSSISSIGYNPFVFCPLLTTIKFSSNTHFKFEDGMLLTKDGKELISFIHVNKSETDFIQLPDELEIIGPYAVAGNQLQLLVIPMNVNKIGEYAFSYCESLQHVYYLGLTTPSFVNNIFYKSDNVKQVKVKNDFTDTQFNGNLISKQSKNNTGDVHYFLDTTSGLLVIYGTGDMNSDYYDYENYLPTNAPWKNYREQLKSLIIEYGVTSVGQRAFIHDTDYLYLTQVRLGKTLKYFYKYAFHSCGFKKVVFPDSVELIGDNALYSCPYLTTIIIGSGVKSFGINTFSYSSELTTFHFYGLNEPSDGNNIFYGCNKLKTVYVPKDYNGPTDSFCGDTDISVSPTL